jgi:hypothetical protein
MMRLVVLVERCAIAVALTVPVAVVLLAVAGG